MEDDGKGNQECQIQRQTGKKSERGKLGHIRRESPKQTGANINPLKQAREEFDVNSPKIVPVYRRGQNREGGLS